jgi:hypothetical protein
MHVVTLNRSLLCKSDTRHTTIIEKQTSGVPQIALYVETANWLLPPLLYGRAVRTRITLNMMIRLRPTRGNNEYDGSCFGVTCMSFDYTELVSRPYFYALMRASCLRLSTSLRSWDGVAGCQGDRGCLR